MRRGRRAWMSGMGVAVLLALGMSSAARAAAGGPEQALARQILDATGIQGGLVVHLGCGDGRLTAALRAGGGYVVQGLDTSAANVERAREYLLGQGVYGAVTVERWDGRRLPYVDNLVNLIVAEEPEQAPQSELLRALAPEGVAYVKRGQQWEKIVKPRPAGIDEWPQYLHDATNNAVAHDTVVGPPKHFQWIGGPQTGRHHDNLSSFDAMVSAGGRVFYVMDEGSRASILLPARWSLVARDAFNGVVLWKRPIPKWFPHLWPLKSGPAQLPRRLVADAQRVYVTLDIGGPLLALDAATGQTVRTYEGTEGTEEVILSNGTLFALVDRRKEKPDWSALQKMRAGYGARFWDEAKRTIVALRADTGQTLWSLEERVLPVTLAADGRQVYFHDGESVVSLDQATGKQLWRSVPVDRAREIRAFYAPTLVVYKDVVLFSGGETAGLQTGSWYTSGKDTMTALSAADGKVLWSAYHPPSGYRSPEDLMVANGLVWCGETTSGRASGVFTGRDPRTGAVKAQFPPDVNSYWFHHRCYRGKATDNYLLMSRAGTEFIDIRKQHWIPNYWVRGACLYGLMPANGLLYAPQAPCACYLESKLDSFNALAPARAQGPDEPVAVGPRLERGPAYQRAGALPAAGASADEWATYRGSAERAGFTKAALPAALSRSWAASVGGKVTSPVVAEGKLFVASVDAHTLYAFDSATGKPAWHFIAGGRIDSPPTVYRGRALFGCADGWVYSLRAADGALAWRFRAATADQQMVSYDQLESVWPVHGSVLVQGGALYCVSGRSMFVDGGLRLWRLDPESGRVLSETVLNDRDATGKSIQDYVSWLNMPTALPDILSSDGRYVYMRSQPFRLDGTRLPLQAMPHGADADQGAPAPIQKVEYAHLFSPTGFLDDTEWHRSYWMYGSTFVSGWCGYYLSGRVAPAGRILAFDGQRVYGYGRKPQYYRWSTPMANYLFAADQGQAEGGGPAESRAGGPPVQFRNSPSLNPAGKALTVAAWVKAEKPEGVILSRGGAIQGYALYLKGGQPCFAIRSKEALGLVKGPEKVAGRWVHLAGVLSADKEMRLYVDGKQVASAKAPDLITANPADTMQIGADESSAVGDYESPFPFAGLVDEVRVYDRAESAAEIERLAAPAAPAAGKEPGLVLSCSFDKNASDASGNKNNGQADGLVLAPGKVGKALQLSGKAAPSLYKVGLDWTDDVSLSVRALLLAGKTLFVAGPADLLDEEQAFRNYDDPKVKALLVEQEASLAGKKGASLWAVSTADGSKLAEYKLDALPVFDGMAAAYGRLYVSTGDGKVVCFSGR